MHTVQPVDKVIHNSSKEPHLKEHKLNMVQKGVHKRHTQHTTKTTKEQKRTHQIHSTEKIPDNTTQTQTDNTTHTQTDNTIHTQIHSIEKIPDKTPHTKVQDTGKITHPTHRAKVEGQEDITVHMQIKKSTKM